MSDTRKMQGLQQTMTELQAACAGLPAPCRCHLGNAMLNLSLGYLIDMHGNAGTATILARVVDALASDQLPACSEHALDPSRLDG